MRKFCFGQLASCLDPKNLRFITAIALFGFLLIFFVPVVYDATMFQCVNQGVLGALCPSNPAGLKSIGYTLFHWGGLYSFNGGEDGYSFASPGFTYADGSAPTTFAILVFFALLLAIATAGLLEPELIRRFRLAVIGYVILGLLTLLVGSNLFAFAYHGFGLEFDLLGAALSLIGAAIILYPYAKGFFNRALRPHP